MKKLFTFLALGVGLIMSSCSSDEPGQNIPTENDSNSLYLRIRISDVDAIGRADSDALPDGTKEEDYVQGSTLENEVSKALFYFFDENGIFVCQADVWTGGHDAEGDEAEPQPNQGNNVEYIGDNVVVLSGLKNKSQAKYLITVLNPPAELTTFMQKDVTTMAEFRAKTVNYLMNSENAAKNYFVMSTSSFNNTTDQNTFYDINYPYANKVPEGYLIESKDLPDSPKPEDFDKTLDIYVERLAAKFTLDPASIGPKEVELTLAGAPNTDNNQDGQGRTKVYITLNRVGVMYSEKKSFISKDISGLDTKLTDWANWNIPSLHRSFWGKSVNYDKANTDGLNTEVHYFDINHDAFTGVAARYANETTKPYTTIRNTDNTLKSELTPHFVITATVSLENGGNGETLVEYKGIPYLEQHYKKTVLKALSDVDKLNYYIQTNATETSATYRQVNDTDLGFKKYGDKQGECVPYFTSGDNTKLYAYDANKPDGEKYTEIEDGVNKLNSAINNLYASDNIYPIYFQGGQMTYTVPVQHLLGKDNVYNVTKDGEFGIVRNHWYQLSVDKLLDLGKGVFDPSEGGDIIEITNNPQFSMAASVKLLSWKIVKQSVNL